MNTMYAILAVAGWIWATVFFAWLIWRKLRIRRRRRVMEVVGQHGKSG
ncbi:MAG: hypothetical protein NZ561_06320 [Phycisphaerae bacterium]|nr:hypothetical protein [Phycisphaerae bacterium]MDW8263360.1 hypothetical protein [Phycisphaerales bacterium]